VTRLSIVTLVACLLSAGPVMADPPALTGENGAPERSGIHLPKPRSIGLYAGVDGAYVPRVRDLSTGRTWIARGDIVWNAGLFRAFGLAGRHTAGVMAWSNVMMAMVGNEAGIRVRPLRFLSVEAFYLNHRVDVTWVNGHRIYPAGVIDRGAEAGVWMALEPARRMGLELHAFYRYFHVYTEHQSVLGTALRLRLFPGNRHELRLQVELFEIWRARAREGVDAFTHNTAGELSWRSLLTSSAGICATIRLSMNLLAGEMPMLELKRSVIGEPMGLASLGLFTTF